MPTSTGQLVPAFVRSAVKRTAARAGFEVTRDPFARRLARLCEQAGVRTVLDVGANSGQYAKLIRTGGYQGRIISCEPLAEPCGRLRAAARPDPRWHVVRTALGRERGTVTVHVAGNSYSSSVLDMLPSHADAAPESVYVGAEEAPLTTVDDLLDDVTAASTLLKIDVQGYEGEVLAGASRSLRRIVAVQLELSLVPLYTGQPLMGELVELLSGEGFGLWSIEPGFRDTRTGRMLQCDGIFVRRGLVGP
ncbi:FkbM family methyltransferase [Lentzea sp. NPDC059081]|uniref:FkbM family methyltransferase n=1 Tax=Lentzea sp. NPDC059081 TaxID=3346719 RepID=UPI0036CC835F